MNQNVEYEAQFCHERHRFDGDFCIASVRDRSGSMMTIKGEFAPEEMTEHLWYRFFGRWTVYKNQRTKANERQFAFKSFVPVVAHDKVGIISYLQAAGKGLGLGPVGAEKCWDRWGSEAVKTIRDNPLVLTEIVKSYPKQKCEAIGARLNEQASTENTTIELTSLLSGRGFPKQLARKCIKAWGNQAGRIIAKDPYRLMQFTGCGFNLCDNLYIELGLPRDSLRRQALAAWYAVASSSEGHTWFPVQVPLQSISALRGDNDPEKALELCKRLGQRSPDHYGALAERATDGVYGGITEIGSRRWVAEGSKAASERFLAQRISDANQEDRPQFVTEWETVERQELQVQDHVRCHRCMRKLTAETVHVVDGIPYGPTCVGKVPGEAEQHHLHDWLRMHPVVKKFIETQPSRLSKIVNASIWPEVDQLEISEHQKEKVDQALTGRISILGGSPGTGKTYVVAQIVKAMLRSGVVTPNQIAIGAPTGKAAVRVTENLAANGLPLRARTIHSLLGVGQRDEESGGFQFIHGVNNPWSYRVLIIDESSMIDTSLMGSVMAARARGCHVLLVGDVNQLPPVGHGAPLRDLIAAGLPYGELTEIRRNSGGIVETCAAIRDNQKWESGDNLHLLNLAKPEEQIEKLEAILAKVRENGLDPVWDVQIVTAVNNKSPLARTKLNMHLQGLLNHEELLKHTVFRENDKIVCGKNGYYLAQDFEGEDVVEQDGEVYVANGEIGRVLDIHDKYMVVQIDSPRRIIRVPLGRVDTSKRTEKTGTGCNFDFAYALSVHKSQGAEWPIVIVMLDEYPGAKGICDRSWIYTAISRAKDKCYLVGRKSVANGMCRRNNIQKRKTFLRELVQLERVQDLMQAI